MLKRQWPTHLQTQICWWESNGVTVESVWGRIARLLRWINGLFLWGKIKQQRLPSLSSKEMKTKKHKPKTSQTPKHPSSSVNQIHITDRTWLTTPLKYRFICRQILKLAMKAVLQFFGQYHNTKSIINLMQDNMQITSYPHRERKKKKKNCTDLLFQFKEKKKSLRTKLSCQDRVNYLQGT